MDGNKVTFTISKGLLWVISTTVAGAGSGVAVMNSNPPQTISQIQFKYFEKRLDRIENKLDQIFERRRDERYSKRGR